MVKKISDKKPEDMSLGELVKTMILLTHNRDKIEENNPCANLGGVLDHDYEVAMAKYTQELDKREKAYKRIRISTVDKTF